MVNAKLRHFVTVEPPEPAAKLEALSDVAQEYGIEWDIDRWEVQGRQGVGHGWAGEQRLWACWLADFCLGRVAPQSGMAAPPRSRTDVHAPLSIHLATERAASCCHRTTPRPIMRCSS